MRRDYRRSRPYQRRKICRFCADKNIVLDYKDPQLLRHFITERGKVIPRRISGNCAKHQRELTKSIKRARMVALLPFTITARRERALSMMDTMPR